MLATISTATTPPAAPLTDRLFDKLQNCSANINTKIVAIHDESQQYASKLDEVRNSMCQLFESQNQLFQSNNEPMLTDDFKMLQEMTLQATPAPLLIPFQQKVVPYSLKSDDDKNDEFLPELNKNILLCCKHLGKYLKFLKSYDQNFEQLFRFQMNHFGLFLSTATAFEATATIFPFCVADYGYTAATALRVLMLAEKKEFEKTKQAFLAAPQISAALGASPQLKVFWDQASIGAATGFVRRFFALETKDNAERHIRHFFEVLSALENLRCYIHKPEQTLDMRSDFHSSIVLELEKIIPNVKDFVNFHALGDYFKAESTVTLVDDILSHNFDKAKGDNEIPFVHLRSQAAVDYEEYERALLGEGPRKRRRLNDKIPTPRRGKHAWSSRALQDLPARAFSLEFLTNLYSPFRNLFNEYVGMPFSFHWDDYTFFSEDFYADHFNAFISSLVDFGSLFQAIQRMFDPTTVQTFVPLMEQYFRDITPGSYLALKSLEYNKELDVASASTTNLNTLIHKYQNVLFPLHISFRDAVPISQYLAKANKDPTFTMSSLLLKSVLDTYLLQPHMQILLIYVFGLYMKYLEKQIGSDGSTFVETASSDGTLNMEAEIFSALNNTSAVHSDISTMFSLLVLVKMTDFFYQNMQLDRTITYSKSEYKNLPQTQLELRTFGYFTVESLDEFHQSMGDLISEASVVESSMSTSIFCSHDLQSNRSIASTIQLQNLANLCLSKVTMRELIDSKLCLFRSNLNRTIARFIYLCNMEKGTGTTTLNSFTTTSITDDDDVAGDLLMPAASLAASGCAPCRRGKATGCKSCPFNLFNWGSKSGKGGYNVSFEKTDSLNRLLLQLGGLPSSKLHTYKLLDLAALQKYVRPLSLVDKQHYAPGAYDVFTSKNQKCFLCADSPPTTPVTQQQHYLLHTQPLQFVNDALLQKIDLDENELFNDNAVLYKVSAANEPDEDTYDTCQCHNYLFVKNQKTDINQFKQLFYDLRTRFPSSVHHKLGCELFSQVPGTMPDMKILRQPETVGPCTRFFVVRTVDAPDLSHLCELNLNTDYVYTSGCGDDGGCSDADFERLGGRDSDDEIENDAAKITTYSRKEDEAAQEYERKMRESCSKDMTFDPSLSLYDLVSTFKKELPLHDDKLEFPDVEKLAKELQEMERTLMLKNDFRFDFDEDGDKTSRDGEEKKRDWTGIIKNISNLRMLCDQLIIMHRIVPVGLEKRINIAKNLLFVQLLFKIALAHFQTYPEMYLFDATFFVHYQHYLGTFLDASHGYYYVHFPQFVDYMKTKVLFWNKVPFLEPLWFFLRKAVDTSKPFLFVLRPNHLLRAPNVVCYLGILCIFLAHISEGIYIPIVPGAPPPTAPTPGPGLVVAPFVTAPLGSAGVAPLRHHPGAYTVGMKAALPGAVAAPPPRLVAAFRRVLGLPSA